MGTKIKNPELQSIIANRLIELRHRKGVSQEVVYNDTGVHISRIETSKLNISVSTLSVLCDYYSVSMQEFFSQGFETK